MYEQTCDLKRQDSILVVTQNIAYIQLLRSSCVEVPKTFPSHVQRAATTLASHRALNLRRQERRRAKYGQLLLHSLTYFVGNIQTTLQHNTLEPPFLALWTFPPLYECHDSFIRVLTVHQVNMLELWKPFRMVHERLGDFCVCRVDGQVGFERT